MRVLNENQLQFNNAQLLLYRSFKAIPFTIFQKDPLLCTCQANSTGDHSKESYSYKSHSTFAQFSSNYLNEQMLSAVPISEFFCNVLF